MSNITESTVSYPSKTIRSIGIFSKIEKYLVTIIQAMIGVLLAMMVIIVFSNVIARYFLNSSLAWSEEISRFSMIWLVFLGAVIAYVRGEHLGLDIAMKILPEKGAKGLQIVVNLLVVYAILTLLTGGIDLAKGSLASGWTSPASNVSYGFVYSIVPVSFALFLYFSLINLIDSIIIFANTLKGGE